MRTLTEDEEVLYRDANGAVNASWNVIRQSTSMLVFKTCDTDVDEWMEIRKKMMVGISVVGRWNLIKTEDEDEENLWNSFALYEKVLIKFTKHKLSTDACQSTNTLNVLFKFSQVL